MGDSVAGSGKVFASISLLQLLLQLQFAVFRFTLNEFKTVVTIYKYLPDLSCYRRLVSFSGVL